ncbi:HipA domain-containing protein [Paracoccus methylarcula]|uniref:HipA domain-containing protein n=1 Tax=Paracoccus methylarcula TaxID=72022 RepID=UPI0026D12AF7
MIGRDCVGALQFIAGEDEIPDSTGRLVGEPVNEAAIEKLLRGLGQAPLGLSRDDDFRISVAGAQEKTALLRHDGQWKKPHGTTPTTHIFKTQIGRLPGGIDLSDSVENEFYCLKLAEAFGLPANQASMETFGETRALVVERFDRLWARDGRLLRLPQEDCCQALSVPPTLKYQSDGGPRMADILGLLQGSDRPVEDQDTFLKAQIIFWLIRATDGHAKNFSLWLSPGGRYRMTPLYDIVTAQPALDARQIEQKQMKMAMSVGDSRHYHFDKILGRHFVQTAVRGGISRSRAITLLEEVLERLPRALEAATGSLPRGFPDTVVQSVSGAAIARSRRLLTLGT